MSSSSGTTDEGNGGAAVERESERRRVRFGILLVAVFAAFLISGIAEPGQFGQVSRVLLNGATLILALYAAESERRYVRAVTVFVVVAAVVATVVSLVNHPDGSTGRAIDAVLLGCSIPVVAVGTVRNLRSRGTVTMEAVFGVLSVYVLLGMFFAALFGFVAQVKGSTVFDNGIEASVAHCIYFSFTTLTTIGYGDLTTNSNLTHTMSVAEGLLGQIYLVTIVSLIVSNLGQTHSLRVNRRPRER